MTLSPARELARKSLHLAAAIFPIGYDAGVSRRTMLLVLGSLSAAALIVELVRQRHARSRELFVRAAGPLLRVHEQDRLSGATWLVLSLLAAVVVLPRDVAIAAMWSAAAGDASAAIVGRSFGQRRNWSEGKTAIGSLACFVVSWWGIVTIAHLPISDSIVGAAGAAAGERLRGPLDDNLRIVIACATAILLWRIVFS